MKRDYIAGFGAAIAVLALLAFAAWSFLETYPTTKWISPSREARMNEYLALDRWLAGSGIPVRVESSGDISMIMDAGEKKIFMQSSLFRWGKDSVEYIIEWIEEGGLLFLVLDMDLNAYRINNYPNSRQDLHVKEPLRLLEAFGITAVAGTGLPGYHYDPNAPGFDHDVSFELDSEDDSLVFRDWTGLARLVEVESGKGKLIVSGRPVFLLSPYLEDAPNARLAWAIFGERNDEGFPSNGGCLFIRGTARVSGLLGSLFSQGNFSVLLASIVVLLVVCFWTVIPVFGLVHGIEEKPGKSLEERFLAEGRFLEKHGALDLYRFAYVKEIKRRLGKRISSDEEIYSLVPEILGKTRGEKDLKLLTASLRGEPFTYREFPKMIIIFRTILERI